MTAYKDLFEYLPETLRNQHIVEGHNTYAKAKKAVAAGTAGPVAKARVFRKAAVMSAKKSGGDVKAVKKAAAQGLRKTIFNQKVAQGKKMVPGQKMTKEKGGFKV